MKKIILFIGMLILPIASHAEWSAGIGSNTLKFRTPDIASDMSKYFGSSSMSGHQIDFGYRGKKWSWRAGIIQLHTSRAYPISSLKADLKLPDRLTGTLISASWEAQELSFATDGYIYVLPSSENSGMEEIVLVAPQEISYTTMEGEEATNLSTDGYTYTLPDWLSEYLKLEEIVLAEPQEFSYILEAGEESLSYDIDLSPVYDEIHSHVSMDVDVYYVDMLRHWQPTEKFGLYAGFGVMNFAAKAEATIGIGKYISVTESIEDDVTSLRIIFGGSYAVTDSTDITTEVVYVTDSDYHLATILRYRFGK